MKSVIAAAILAVFTTGAEANEQLRRAVSFELARYDIEVDVRDLSTGELAAIQQIANSDRSYSDKRGLIRSAVGGRYSLRGLLFGR